MGFDGNGYRVSATDLELIQRIGASTGHAHVQEAYLARQRVLLDPESDFGMVPSVCWDDLPPIQFERIRRLVGGQSQILPLTPAAARTLEAVPESVWSAVEGGRPVVTARQVEELLGSTSVEGARRIGEIRGRVTQHALIEHGIFAGDTDPLVLRDCALTDSTVRQTLWDRVVFQDCDFSRTSFVGCVFTNCEVINCVFDNSRWGSWHNRSFTVRGLAKDKKTKESADHEIPQINWGAVNVCRNTQVRGDGISITKTSGVGPALFMPPLMVDKLNARLAVLRAECKAAGLRLMQGQGTRAMRHQLQDLAQGRACCRALIWRPYQIVAPVEDEEGDRLNEAHDADPLQLLERLRLVYPDNKTLMDFNLAAQRPAKPKPRKPGGLTAVEVVEAPLFPAEPE